MLSMYDILYILYIMDIIDNNFYKEVIINKNNIFEKLYSILIADTVKTRAATSISTTPCRFWQLFYMILREYNKATYGELVHDIQHITQNQFYMPLFYEKYVTIYNIFNTTSNARILSAIVAKNINVEGEIIALNRFSNLRGQNSNFCLCLYQPALIGQPGSIAHFFTVFICDDITYLNSSYGSELICVPQYSTELNISEFDELCMRIRDLTNVDNYNFFNYFFKKYFGALAKKKLYDQDEIDENKQLRFKWKGAEEGIQEESAFYKNTNNYAIGWIHNYELMLQQHMQESNGQLEGGQTCKKRIKNCLRSTVKAKFNRKTRKYKGRKTRKYKVRKTRKYHIRYANNL